MQRVCKYYEIYGWPIKHKVDVNHGLAGYPLNIHEHYEKKKIQKQQK